MPFERGQIDDGIDHAQLFIQSSFFGQVAQLVLGGFTQFLAEDFNLAGVRLDDVHHHSDGGGFTGAVGPDQAEYLVLSRRRRIRSLHRSLIGVGLGYMIHFNCRHSQ